MSSDTDAVQLDESAAELLVHDLIAEYKVGDDLPALVNAAMSNVYGSGARQTLTLATQMEDVFQALLKTTNVGRMAARMKKSEAIKMFLMLGMIKLIEVTSEKKPVTVG